MSFRKPQKRQSTLKAGGGQSTAIQDHQEVKQLTPVISKYLERIYKDCSSSGYKPEEDEPPLTSLEDFKSWFQSPASAALAPPIDHNLTFPLCNYYISSSHNTYLSGNQLYGEATTEAYTNVLLRGCRCLEIDVYNGSDESSSVSSSDVEDIDKDRLSTTPRKDRAVKRFQSIRGKASDKLHRSRSKSPSESRVKSPLRRKEPAELDQQIERITHDVENTDLVERAAQLKGEPRVYHGYTL